MRIATYNLRKGGARRVHWVKMIEDQGVDLLLVQESYASHEHLPSEGYPAIECQSAWRAAGRNNWGSALFARAGSVKSLPVRGFRGWVVGAEIRGTGWQSSRAAP